MGYGEGAVPRHWEGAMQTGAAEEVVVVTARYSILYFFKIQFPCLTSSPAC
jgi:hypothetical protein